MSSTTIGRCIPYSRKTHDANHCIEKHYIAVHYYDAQLQRFIAKHNNRRNKARVV